MYDSESVIDQNWIDEYELHKENEREQLRSKDEMHMGPNENKTDNLDDGYPTDSVDSGQDTEDNNNTMITNSNEDILSSDENNMCTDEVNSQKSWLELLSSNESNVTGVFSSLLDNAFNSSSTTSSSSSSTSTSSNSTPSNYLSPTTPNEFLFESKRKILLPSYQAEKQFLNALKLIGAPGFLFSTPLWTNDTRLSFFGSIDLYINTYRDKVFYFAGVHPSTIKPDVVNRVLYGEQFFNNQNGQENTLQSSESDIESNIGLSLSVYTALAYGASLLGLKSVSDAFLLRSLELLPIIDAKLVLNDIYLSEALLCLSAYCFTSLPPNSDNLINSIEDITSRSVCCSLVSVARNISTLSGQLKSLSFLRCLLIDVVSASSLSNSQHPLKNCHEILSTTGITYSPGISRPVQAVINKSISLSVPVFHALRVVILLSTNNAPSKQYLSRTFNVIQSIQLEIDSTGWAKESKGGEGGLYMFFKLCCIAVTLELIGYQGLQHPRSELIDLADQYLSICAEDRVNRGYLSGFIMFADYIVINVLIRLNERERLVQLYRSLQRSAFTMPCLQMLLDRYAYLIHNPNLDGTNSQASEIRSQSSMEGLNLSQSKMQNYSGVQSETKNNNSITGEKGRGGRGRRRSIKKKEAVEFEGPVDVQKGKYVTHAWFWKTSKNSRGRGKRIAKTVHNNTITNDSYNNLDRGGAS